MVAARLEMKHSRKYFIDKRQQMFSWSWINTNNTLRIRECLKIMIEFYTNNNSTNST